jgi:hypothetical protein
MGQRVTLVADLSERPARWERVASIPFGDSVRRLGFIHDRRFGTLAYIPRSFAIDRDGSIWILERIKHRIAHFDRSGGYLGQIPISPPDNGIERDLAVVAGGLAMLQEVHPQITRIESRITFPSSTPADPWVIPQTDGTDVYVSLLFPPPDPMSDPSVIGGIHAWSDLSGAPGAEFAEFAPDGDGAAAFLPGLPLGKDTWVNLEGRSEQAFEVRFTSGERTFTQPVRVRVVTGADGGHAVPAIVGPAIEVALPSAVGILVELAPSRPADADRYGGGRWYLQLGPEGDPLVWEPIVYGYHQQEEQVRHLALGPDGSVYMMVLTRHGEVIYRRP